MGYAMPLSTLKSVTDVTLVSASPQMEIVLQLARRAGRSDAKVLITGESGVGKDLIAREVHRASPRAHAPYVPVNCAGLTETLLETELFGHVKGSFTGAHRDNPGRLQMAHNGTLFLDEVGEMSLRMQALLLRFLENGEVQPVGDSRIAARVNVRVIVATNRNLQERVAAGQFREDLLYRLRVIHIHVPPLRERSDDIRALITHFAGRSKDRRTFSAEAMRLLMRYPWPGNVRELQNVVEQAVWLANGEVIEPADLPDSIRAVATMPVTPRKERRRQVADQLFEALTAGTYSFWSDVHPLFLSRDLTRHDIRQLVTKGLEATHGNYRALLKLFGMTADDYHRFHNFLAAHECKVDFRAFRGAGERADTARRPSPAPHSAPGDAASPRHGAPGEAVFAR
jgi:DNA-binding NtrC family response regulator